MSGWDSSLHFVLLPKAELLGSAKKGEERSGKIQHIKMGFLPQDSQLQPLFTATCWHKISCVLHSSRCLGELAGNTRHCRKSNPSHSPFSSLYLDFIEEFSIQQGQLLSYFMTVEIMQCPWPVENKEEVAQQM